MLWKYVKLREINFKERTLVSVCVLALAERYNVTLFFLFSHVMLRATHVRTADSNSALPTSNTVIIKKETKVIDTRKATRVLTVATRHLKKNEWLAPTFESVKG